MASTCIDGFGNCRGESAVPQIHFKHLQSGQQVKFPPFLEDFSDEYVSSWNEEPVYGRMDPIAVYQRTSRVITITWKVISANEVEAVDNMAKIRTLVSFHYPSYFGKNNAGKMQTAPVLRFKFPPFVQNVATGGGLMGYTKGVTFKPNVDAGFVFVGGIMLPKEVTLNCQFTVLHTHQLGFDANSNKRFNSNFPYSLPKRPAGCGGAADETLPPKTLGNGGCQEPEFKFPSKGTGKGTAGTNAAQLAAGANVTQWQHRGAHGEAAQVYSMAALIATNMDQHNSSPRLDAQGLTTNRNWTYDAATGMPIHNPLPFTDEELDRELDEAELEEAKRRFESEDF